MARTRDNTASIPETSLFSDVRSLEESGLRAAERRYEPGDTVFMAGEPADRLYLLIEGMVRVCKPYGSYSQATIALLKDRGGFGEFDLFGKDQQSASAEALTGCRVASIRKSDLRYAMERDPGLAVELFSLFSEKLRYSEQMMTVLLNREIIPRLSALLPGLAERFADNTGEDAGESVIPLSHSELAEMIASTREAVSKALGQLQSEGLVELGPRRIRVKNLHSLQEYTSVSLLDSGSLGDSQ